MKNGMAKPEKGRECAARPWKRASAVAGTLLLLGAAAFAGAPNADQATRMYNRIAGVPPTAAQLAQMTASPDSVSAALLATHDPSFYNNTIRNMAAPWTNRDQSVFVPLNDYTATVVGMVRDDVPFNTLLSADLVYIGAAGGIPAYSPANNDMYQTHGQQQYRSVVQGEFGLQHPVGADRHPRGGDGRRHDDPSRSQCVLHGWHEPQNVPLHDDESSVQ